MDDTLCRRFFLEPDQPLHRRYAALRAFFIDGLSLPAIAAQFGTTYHTVRSWVRDFRLACRAGPVPPFLPSRAWAGQRAKATLGRRPSPTSRPSPTPANSAWRRGGGCAAGWRVSSSSSPCWPAWVSTP
jgi:hypothetical protein